jgi:hypothetical protein
MATDRGEGLAISGWILISLGVIGALLGMFVFDPSVEVSSVGEYGLPSRVANLQAMQLQSNFVLLSGLLALAGVVLCGFAAVVRAIQAGAIPVVETITASAPGPLLAPSQTTTVEPITEQPAPVEQRDDTWLYILAAAVAVALCVGFIVAGSAT